MRRFEPFDAPVRALRARIDRVKGRSQATQPTPSWRVIGLHSIDESRPQAGFTGAPNGLRSSSFLRFSVLKPFPPSAPGPDGDPERYLQTKFTASSVLPEPLYVATCG